MPVKIPDHLPARKILEQENIAVISESEAFTQDIRPLQVAIVNIMPLKIATETHLLRLLSHSPLQVAVTLLHPRSYTSTNTEPEHLSKFYKNFEDIRNDCFDCLIITGAPVETIEFNKVAYWDELQQIMEWSRTNVYSSMHLCWGAQAGLYHHYSIPKYTLPQKKFGVFPHRVVANNNALLHGFDDIFFAPHSRYTEVRGEDIRRIGALQILAESDTAGVYLIRTHNDRQIFITGHPEYDQLTLKWEYERDCAKKLGVHIPENYFPDNDPMRHPSISWRSHASLLITNWLNLVYQKTPFDLRAMPRL